jgi:hypothetical protein
MNSLITNFLIENYFCLANYCSPNDQFKCRNGTCIPISQRCDGRIDCADFTDETDCPQTNCDRYQFKCNNGSCIPLQWKWLVFKPNSIYKLLI